MLSTFDLDPGRSLGPFELGSTLWHVISHLRTARERVEWSRASIAWEDEACNEAPIMLSLASPPLTLLFEAATQLLVLIEVLDPGRWVTYRGATLAADEGRATRRGLSRTFGPTEAPKAHPSAPNESLVSYPGATFGLSAPSSGKAETVTRVVVTANAASTANPFEAALTSTPLRPADTADRIAIDLREGKSALTVHFTPSRPPLELLLRATSAEDLRLDLGAPTRHFIREDERLRIHSATPFAEDPAYFASHFDLGIDFLLDGRTHRLLKVVLHSNLPGEALFGRYAKCSWSLTTASGQTIQCTDKADKLLSTLSTAPVPSKSKTTSTPREAPLVLDRTADAPDGLAPGRTTELHGFPGIAIETTQAGDVETLWLF